MFLDSVLKLLSVIEDGHVRYCSIIIIIIIISLVTMVTQGLCSAYPILVSVPSVVVTGTAQTNEYT